MKYLVIGKGFIGSKLGEKLDGEVKYLDRTTGDYRKDVTEEFEIEEEFDAVYHTVGLAPGFATEKQYRKVHVKGTENILEAVNTDKIIYVSAMNPEINHPFFQTKKEAEKLIKESRLDYTIVRPSTVIGEGNKLLELIKKFSVTRMFPEIPTMMQPIRLEDLTDAMTKLATDRDNETLNMGGPEKMKVSEMAKRLYREQGRSCYILPIPEEVIKLNIKAFSFLGPPFNRENVELIGAENMTEENHAPQLTQLEKAL